eukprot:ctg_71.g10
MPSDQASPPEIPTTKSALKRQRKVERYVAQRLERREARKRRRQAEADRRRQTWQQRQARLTPEEWALQKADADARRRRERAWTEQARDLLAQCELSGASDGYCCLVDFGFSAQLTDKELRKSVLQLREIYVANKTAAAQAVRQPAIDRPAAVFAVGACGLDAHVRRHFDPVLGAGWSRWPSMHFLDTPLESLDFCVPDRVVYLTADAPEPLESVRPGIVYVIGGMVDRNRLKGAALQRAHCLWGGVCARRLPLERSPHVASRAAVLATCHVFQLLLRVANGAAWAPAIDEVVPQRKQTRNGASTDTRSQLLSDAEGDA